MSGSEVIKNEINKLDPQSRIVLEILQERTRQDQKFGSLRNYTELEWTSVLSEEAGEVSQSVNDIHFAFKDGKVSQETYVQHLKEKYRPELIQVAAVALAAVEEFDRKLRG